MTTIIVEDEITATRKLKSILEKLNVEVLACLPSVKEAVEWINHNPSPDMGFFDIQLSDATSFEIFEKCTVNFPVVFATAFDDYLMKAFEYNSLHYLLKPLAFEKVKQALDKIHSIKGHFIQSSIRDLLNEGKTTAQKSFKQRLIVRLGMDFIPLPVDEIAYIFTAHKVSFVKDIQGSTYTVDETLTELENSLDPNQFFRANRQNLIQVQAIQRFRSIEHGKILLEIDPQPETSVVVGKERAVLFRKWINRSI